MKAYVDYMNHIAVDAVLHEKIMRQSPHKATSRPRKRTALRLAGVAACAVVLLLGIWAVPGLFNNAAHPITSGATIPLPSQQQSVGPAPSASDMPVDPDATAHPRYPLTLNPAGSYMQGSIVIPGHFWYPLTDEQLAVLFPNFSAELPNMLFPVAATVHYRGDGSIFNVSAYEISDGEVVLYNGLYPLTEITFAPGEVAEDVVYDYEPIPSDVDGIPVIAGVFDHDGNDGVALYMASFKLSGIAYRVNLYDDETSESGLERLTDIVNVIIRKGTPDLSVLEHPVIPLLRDEMLTLEQAHTDPDFGAYLPQDVPSLLNFESAQRFINQESNYLSASWHSGGYDYIQWRVAEPAEYDLARLVSTNELEKYDLSLYSIPFSDSVPDELRDIVDNPVFRMDELSLDVIQARAFQLDDAGDTPGWRMTFSILVDDVIIHISSKGVSPQQLWEMFNELKAA